MNTLEVLAAMQLPDVLDLPGAIAKVAAVDAALAARPAPAPETKSNTDTAKAERIAWRALRDDARVSAERRDLAHARIAALNARIGSGAKPGEDDHGPR